MVASCGHDSGEEAAWREPRECLGGAAGLCPAVPGSDPVSFAQVLLFLQEEEEEIHTAAQVSLWGPGGQLTTAASPPFLAPEKAGGPCLWPCLLQPGQEAA